MSTKKHDDDTPPKNEGTNRASTNPEAPPAHPPGHMPSINEPAGSNTAPTPVPEKKDPAEASSGVVNKSENVSHETSDDDDGGDEHGHSKRGGARRHR